MRDEVAAVMRPIAGEVTNAEVSAVLAVVRRHLAELVQGHEITGDPYIDPRDVDWLFREGS
jgi:hypothetical protein